MVRDILPELGALLNGIQVVDPVLVFDYVAYGPHWDMDRHVAKDHGIVYARQTSKPTRRSNMGGGASRGSQFVEIRAEFEDHEDIADMDTYKRAVREAVEAVIRANEHDFTDSFSVAVVDGAGDPSELIEGEVLRNVVSVLVEAKTTETW